MHLTKLLSEVFFHALSSDLSRVLVLHSHRFWVEVLDFLLVFSLDLVAHLMGHLLHKRRDDSEVKARGVLGEAEGSSLQRDGSFVVCLAM